MAAGLATLRELSDAVYDQLEAYGARLEAGLTAVGAVPRATRIGSLLTVFFDDDERFARFFHAMLEHGVMLPPSQQEAWFISAAHGEAELACTIDAAGVALKEVVSG
jgi:glutamate-1-semialdehyde 2,1-aminomutase